MFLFDLKRRRIYAELLVSSRVTSKHAEVRKDLFPGRNPVFCDTGLGYHTMYFVSLIEKYGRPGRVALTLG